jgi:hypothetical protein
MEAKTFPASVHPDHLPLRGQRDEHAAAVGSAKADVGRQFVRQIDLLVEIAIRIDDAYPAVGNVRDIDIAFGIHSQGIEHRIIVTRPVQSAPTPGRLAGIVLKLAGAFHGKLPQAARNGLRYIELAAIGRQSDAIGAIQREDRLFDG